MIRDPHDPPDYECSICRETGFYQDDVWMYHLTGYSIDYVCDGWFDSTSTCRQHAFELLDNRLVALRGEHAIAVRDIAHLRAVLVRLAFVTDQTGREDVTDIIKKTARYERHRKDNE